MILNLLTFCIGDQLFAIDTKYIKEVASNFVCTPTPTSAEHIIGLFNLRGQIAVLLDFSQMSGGKAESYGQTVPYAVILKRRSGSDIIGFAVDRADDVLTVDASQIRKPPSNLDERMTEMLSGVIEYGDKLLLVVSAEHLTNNI